MGGIASVVAPIAGALGGGGLGKSILGAVIGQVVGGLLSGGAKSPSVLKLPPVPEEDTRGALDQEAVRLRALRRRREAAQKSSLLGLQEEDANINVKTLLGQ